jgi:hypothetical protein
MSPLWFDMALARATAAKAGLPPEQPQTGRPADKANKANTIRRILRSKRASFAL